MRTIIKGDMLMLVPESGSEAVALAKWRDGRTGHVLALLENAGRGATIQFLGLREDVCREPINVTSKHPDPKIQLIGNLAATPFELAGKRYSSVESFWQCLKFPEGEERDRIALQDGNSSRTAGSAIALNSQVSYSGNQIAVGSREHWQLMEDACRAKFEQNPDAKAALMATGERPLIYRVRKGCPALPGPILAEIWMGLRREFWGMSKKADEVIEEE